MIREEVEKLRGTTFTKEELKEVIIPMLTATKLTKATFKKAMKIFADEFNNYFKIGGVRGATWVYGKDYSWEDVRDKIYQQVKSDWNNFVDFIDSRLDDEVLDRMVEDRVLEEEEPKTRVSIMNLVGQGLEFEGTKEQIEAFEAERKKRNKDLFPRALSLIEIIKLSLDYGLTITKVVT